MKKIFILLLVLIQIGCSNNDEPKYFGQPDIKIDEDGNSLLWMITSDNLQDTSFLFGTMHLIQKEYYYFPENLEKLIASSETIVMEVVGEPSQMEMMKMMSLDEGSLFDILNEEQGDSLLAWGQENMGMSENSFKSSFGKMKPFAVSILTMAALMKGDTESYEMDITKLMKSQKIKGVGLETIEEQLAVFDDFTDEEQVQMLMESIKDDEKNKNLTERMQQVYKRQNIDSLQLMIIEESGSIADKESLLLDDRNKKWIPRIEKLIAKKRTFIAVGAGHLAGPQGVIKLLQKAGYTLTPIEL
ncbi:MAG: TraB/GumN family protein [Crocinitomicaceae bacterium]|nr:TraB/GumN family protein [Crocinitomicaceae bacterium]